LREALYELMWDDVGVFRDAAGLRRAETALAALDDRVDRTGISGTSLAFNLTWHDWLNLKSLILVSRAITAASLARAESRGAHFRSDFPGTEPDDGAAFTKVRLEGDDMALDWERVRFTRIKPGDTLLNP
jgi:fumarate reductase flavoprotein subunit